MARRSRSNRLERWEIALIKTMIAQEKYNDQDILAYFTRPTRTINHARIKEIRDGTKHSSLKAASAEEVSAFLDVWPAIDWKTGLHIYGDERLIKAREAMMAAVQAFNSPGRFFRAELFIVSAIIAWTYLIHSHFQRISVDFRHKKSGTIVKTKGGAEKYWELAQCLKHKKCPFDPATIANLDFLLELRHEIEHRMTTRIDDTVSAKLQACALNFNHYLGSLFGGQAGLESELSLALQFGRFAVDQQRAVARAKQLPENIRSIQNEFEKAMPIEVYSDPRYAFRVALVQKVVTNKGNADEVIEFVRNDTEEAKAISRVLLKEIEKQKYKPKQIVKAMHAEGFPRFQLHHHSDLWRALGAKDPKKGYGIEMGDGQWYWYETWLNRVREHCTENTAVYKNREAPVTAPAAARAG
jgi:hypothetical protein